MLPAIWFIFSRRDCDLAARHLDMHGVVLTSAEGAAAGGHWGAGGGCGGGLRRPLWRPASHPCCPPALPLPPAACPARPCPAERASIQAELDALAADQPEAVKGGFTAALLAGVASHHAGCLPAWKGLVERLFQRGGGWLACWLARRQRALAARTTPLHMCRPPRPLDAPPSPAVPPLPRPPGLLKLVFATETLAAGINMPARTTLIAALSRRRDGGIGALHHNELLQMAGRAGRRGYDTVGHCVILQVGVAGCVCGGVGGAASEAGSETGGRRGACLRVTAATADTVPLPWLPRCAAVRPAALQSKWEDADVAWDIIRRGPEPLRSQVPACSARGQGGGRRPPAVPAALCCLPPPTKPVASTEPAVSILQFYPIPWHPPAPPLLRSSPRVTAWCSTCCTPAAWPRPAPSSTAPSHDTLAASACRWRPRLCGRRRQRRAVVNGTAPTTPAVCAHHTRPPACPAPPRPRSAGWRRWRGWRRARQGSWMMWRAARASRRRRRASGPSARAAAGAAGGLLGPGSSGGVGLRLHSAGRTAITRACPPACALPLHQKVSEAPGPAQGREARRQAVAAAARRRARGHRRSAAQRAGSPLHGGPPARLLRCCCVPCPSRPPPPLPPPLPPQSCCWSACPCRA